MLDSVLQPIYDKLEKKAVRNNKYARPLGWLTGSWSWVLSVGLLLFLVFLYIKILDFIPYLAIAVFLYYIGYKIATYLLNKKLKVYRLNPQELATFYMCGIIINVDSLSDPDTSKNPDLKKECQKTLEEQSKALLSVLERDWTIGYFKLGERIFGTSLSTLKQEFRKRVIPNIEHGDLRDLEKIQTAMLDLVYANSVQSLEHVNEIISKLEPRESRKKGYWNALVNGKAAKYLKEREAAQHVFFGSAFLFAGFVVYFVALNLVQLPKDASFAAAIGFLGVLIMAYATVISTRARRKEKVQ